MRPRDRENLGDQWVRKVFPKEIKIGYESEGIVGVN